MRANPMSRPRRSAGKRPEGERNEAPRLAALGHGPRRWRARDRERGNERDTPGGLPPNVVEDEAVREARGLGQAAPAHLKHAADIIRTPLGGCPKSLMTPTSGGRAFTVALTGEAETPAGDPVGTGTATIRLRAGQGQVCYQLVVDNLAAGGRRAHPPGSERRRRACRRAAHDPRRRTASRAAVRPPRGPSSRRSSPSRRRTTSTSTRRSSRRGAIRGQLTGTSTASFGWVVAVDLKGTSEPNANGTAVVRVRQDAGMVCYRLHAANVTLPTMAAHIHRGGATVNGPVVVPFTAPGADGNSSGCANADAPSSARSSAIRRVLRQRAHERASRRRHPRAARLTRRCARDAGERAALSPERSASRIARIGAGRPVQRSNDATPWKSSTSSPSTTSRTPRPAPRRRVPSGDRRRCRRGRPPASPAAAERSPRPSPACVDEHVEAVAPRRPSGSRRPRRRPRRPPRSSASATAFAAPPVPSTSARRPSASIWS